MEKNYVLKVDKDIYFIDNENKSKSYVKVDTIEYLLNRQYEIIKELKAKLELREQ